MSSNVHRHGSVFRAMLTTVLVLQLLAVGGCMPHQIGEGSAIEYPARKPRLVVGIVVDQMRFDYLQKFWSNFGEGGFKRLIEEGTSFTHCNYNYVPTETAPGHASIFTGTSPSGHGIIMNDWIDPSNVAKGIVKSHSSVEDSLYPYVGVAANRTKGRGVAPTWLRGSTIADQLKAATKGKSKCVGVSLKDRSAILPVGRSADAAFFFDDATGNMISSSYYPTTKTKLPYWVDSLNALRQPAKYLHDPKGWTLLLDAAKYNSVDNSANVRYEGTYTADDHPTFIHHFKVDTVNCCLDFKTTPWGNRFVKDFAIQTIKHFQLGADGVTDFLSVSFSSTDMVGHQFGIESRELEDTYIRLDRDLAELLNFLDRRVGRENVMVFLTADHGGAANPVYANDHHEEGGWIESMELRDKLRTQLGDRNGQDSLLTMVKGHTVYLNHRLAERRHLDFDSLCKVVAKATMGTPGIKEVHTSKEVAAMSPTSPAGIFLKNGYDAERSGDVMWLSSYGFMQPAYSPKEPFRYKKGTSHGTHYDYDTHVPLIWWGWSIPNMIMDQEVVIPDIAPTVCHRLGIAPTSKCSGKVITGF